MLVAQLSIVVRLGVVGCLTAMFVQGCISFPVVIQQVILTDAQTLVPQVTVPDPTSGAPGTSTGKSDTGSTVTTLYSPSFLQARLVVQNQVL